MSKVQCGICPHNCLLGDGDTGFCRARSNRGGIIVDDNYGQITSMALDPIEKKPLSRFHPGSRILSVGSFGCNLRCPFCQNHEISMAGLRQIPVQYVAPETLVAKARELAPAGNIGIAFTYNEPLIGYEYVRDCAALAKEQGLQAVLVTNGYVNPGPLAALLPFVDAMNIDLKGFTETFYHKIGGSLEPVRQAIALAAQHCHVEVTTLIIPGENDTPQEMHALSEWLAGVGREIPLHVSRFFPRYHMTDCGPTEVASIHALAEIARESLAYVYEGNC